MEWWNGGMVEWWNGGMVGWWNGGMVEWWNGGMVLSKYKILTLRISNSPNITNIQISQIFKYHKYPNITNIQISQIFKYHKYSNITNIQISQISKLSLMSTNFIMDFLFGIGLPSLASSFELKEILKSPANIILTF